MVSQLELHHIGQVDDLSYDKGPIWMWKKGTSNDGRVDGEDGVLPHSYLRALIGLSPAARLAG